MDRDDVYPVRTSKVGCLLHCCQSCIVLVLYIIQTYDARKLKHKILTPKLRRVAIVVIRMAPNMAKKQIMFELTYVMELGCINTFTAIVDLSRFNNLCLKSLASTLVDLTFQSRVLRSFSLNQLRNMS